MNLTHPLSCLLLAPWAIAQAPTLVQQAVGSAALAADLTVALPQPPTPASVLIVCHDSTSGGSSTITGGGVSQWILCQSTLPTQDNSEIWAGFVDGPLDNVIRLRLGGSPNDASVVVSEWRGLLPPLTFASAFTTGVGGTAVAPAGGAAVFANSGDLVVAMVGTHSTDQSIGPPSNGFVDLLRPISRPSSVMAAAYCIPTTSGDRSTAWTFPYSSRWASAAVAFRAAHSGTWGGSGNEAATQVAVDPLDGSWAVAGRTASFGRANDFLLARFDGNGNALSAAAWGGALDEEVRDLALVTGGQAGIWLTGSSNSFGGSASDRDIVLVRHDRQGALQWGARWSSNSNLDERGEALCVSPAGNVFVAGTVRTANRGDEALLLRFAPVANGAQPTAPTLTMWGRSSGDEGLAAVVLDTVPTSVRLYVAGSTTGFGNGNRDVLVQRYDTDMALQWTRTWGGAGADEAASAAVDAQGNLYTAGSTQTGSDPTDALLIKWNAQGTLQWRVTMGGAAADSLRRVLVDCNGDVVVTGVTASAGAGQQDGLLAKFDAAGALLWAQTWGGALADELGATAIAGCADLIVAGSSTAEGNLVLWTPPTVSRSTSTSGVTSPTNAVGTPPSGQLRFPTLPAATAPGVAQGVDVQVQRHLGATTAIAPGCPAVMTTTGGPQLSFDSPPVLGGTVRIRRTSTQACELTALLLGTQSAPQPLSVFGGTVAGATVCLVPTMDGALFPGTSPTVFALTVPLLPALHGVTLDCQWIDLFELGNSTVGHLRAGW